MGKRAADKSAVSTAVTNCLTEHGIAYAIHRYERTADTEGYGLSTARALDIEPNRVFETIVATVDGKLMNAVVPASAELDLKALAATVGAGRAELTEAKVAEKITGFEMAGISPLAQRQRLPTILDVSALDHATIYLSGGKPGLDIEMSPNDLIRLTQARTAPISRH